MGIIKNIKIVQKNVENKKISKNTVEFLINHGKVKEHTQLDSLYFDVLTAEIKYNFNEKDIKRLLKKYPELMVIIL